MVKQEKCKYLEPKMNLWLICKGTKQTCPKVRFKLKITPRCWKSPGPKKK